MELNFCLQQIFYGYHAHLCMVLFYLQSIRLLNYFSRCSNVMYQHDYSGRDEHGKNGTQILNYKMSQRADQG